MISGGIGSSDFILVEHTCCWDGPAQVWGTETRPQAKCKWIFTLERNSNSYAHSQKKSLFDVFRSKVSNTE